MSEPRSVVITGASRGLGLASAAHLYRQGWRVVAAMRSVDAGMAALRTETAAAEGDPRLIGVTLDLTDLASVTAAAKSITEAVGAPYAIVHNAGISAAGMVEEAPMSLWERMFATNIFGPVALTKVLLPSMRSAGRGRIVLISSAGGIRGMPATAAYSAVKGALERWGESMASEVAPFGIGVTILVTGTYDTEIITDAGTTDNRVLDGPYARHHRTMDKRGREAMRRAAKSPARFATGLAQALESDKPFVRHCVGPDARMLLIANRMLPGAAMHTVTRLMMGIPRFGALGGTSAATMGAPEENTQESDESG
ncbi:SDR family oxidoreductase [Mycolicibacterium celeriflavum]|uniref:Short-chain dehydrogenase/reductase n=1 Tax=Mycolicibacterium celeriflavum TaxID=1249101 RepID=A0A1X0C2N2_MYCCF|nr:SDR family oxidoreductase [Mycolicibacterium celeriflavum]MCV7239584.1 SDR family oxidoreductase [Mycolicibacterium celeriflavum]ORA51592.1 short-chain dehydrogenase/reductase [Mycolicibacterium celeriflavum]BBY43276.1 short-chain dehydrogenase/reductase [Mycolicibacterium celeriflavum]